MSSATKKNALAGFDLSRLEDFEKLPQSPYFSKTRSSGGGGGVHDIKGGICSRPEGNSDPNLFSKMSESHYYYNSHDTEPRAQEDKLLCRIARSPQ